MSDKNIPRGWLIFWATACAFTQLDSDLVRKAVDLSLNTGFDEPELIEIAITDDLRGEEGVALLKTMMERLGLHSMAHDDVLNLVARQHLRDRLAKGDSPALAAFGLPEICVRGEKGDVFRFLHFRCLGEEIYHLEIKLYWPWSRQEIERVRGYIPDFERDFNELCVNNVGFSDKETELICMVARDIYDHGGATQYWLDPLSPPDKYQWALEL